MINILYICRNLLIWIVLFLFYSACYAQIENTIYSGYIFRHITMENGLSNNQVNAICHDDIGFMWFGTNEGLNRYDGYNIKIYKHDPVDSNSICTNLVRSIFIDTRKRMWLATEKGVDLYDPDKDIFKHVRTENNLQFSELCWKIFESNNDTLFIASSAGLFLMDESTLIVKDVGKRFKLPLNTEVSVVYQDSKDNFYIGTVQKGVYIFNRSSGTYKHFEDIRNNNNSGKGNWIECIYEDSNGKLWVGTHDNGLNSYDNNNSTFKWIDLEKNEHLSTGISRIRDITSDRFGRLWIGTYQGLYLKNPDNLSFILYASSTSSISEITNNSIFDIYIDKNDLMWLGTFSGGVNYCDFNQKKFKQYTFKKNDNHYLNDLNTYAICEDRNKNIWVGTERGGLNLFDFKKGSFEYFNSDVKGKLLSNEDIIKSLYIDNHNNLWIGTYPGGLKCLDLSSKNFKTYRHNPSNANSLVNDIIYSITADEENNLWIGTREGIDLLPYEKNQFIHFNNKSGEKFGFGKQLIKIVYRDSKNNIWIGSGSIKGLYILNKQDSSFVLASNKVADYDIITICEDVNGNIWAGSSDGLIFYNQNSNRVRLYTEKDGLPSNRIAAVMDDNFGDLWISTDNGLVRFKNAVNNPDSARFKIFNKNTGLKILQFTNNASYKNASGKLFFGGINGFLSFHPEQIVDNPNLPDVKIIGLKILNKKIQVDQMVNNQVILNKSIYTSNFLKLSYKYHVVTFEFSAMQYARPMENKYAYLLEGFDTEWNFTDAGNRLATYTNLPGKEYLFKVKATNIDGTWNETPTELRLRVIPPFWETWWFMTTVIIILLGIIVLIYRIRLYNINQQRKKLKESVALRTAELSEANTLLEEKQEEILLQNEELAKHRYKLEELVIERTSDLENARKKAEEADRLKSAFLANMSHEIRTPMNAIVGFSNLLLTENDDKEKVEYIRIINNNCENLMVLINDILDISLIEANQLKIEHSPFDANIVLSELESIYNLKNKPGINIVLDIPNQNQLILVTDQFRFRQILNNLLSNAIKYTDEGEVRFGFRLEEKNVVFYVSDSGIGIEKNDFMRVFDYFQKLDDDKTKLYKGTGIGLSISKKLVELLGGEIWLESEAGKGSTFSFKLPLSIGSNKSVIIKKQQIAGKELELPVIQIIIAEDESTNFILLEKILKPLKVEIIWVKNGKELVDYIKSSSDLKKSLIIMDIKMPIMNGIDAFHEIRKMNKSIPVIAVTAYATENERKEILQYGFTDYISKPVDVQSLLNAIRNALLGS